MNESGEQIVRRFIRYLAYASACMICIAVASMWPVPGNPADPDVFRRIILRTSIVLALTLFLLIIGVVQVLIFLKARKDPKASIAFNDELFRHNIYHATTIAFVVTIGCWVCLRVANQFAPGLPHEIIERFAIPIAVASLSAALLYLERRARLMSDPVLRNTLKVHRAIHNLTQEQLAELVGVSRKTINAIEGNRFVPSTVIALKLAKALRVPVEEIFSLQESEEREGSNPLPA